MEKFIKPVFSKIIQSDSAENKNIGKFTIEKLEKGFGNTIGVAMRRTILSSIPGMAPFGIKIEGVQHEFQAIDNVKEDVVELILNLKELIIEVEEDLIDGDEVYELKLKSKKQGPLLAGDIVTPNGITIVNKDLVIANTVANSAIEMLIYTIYSKGFKTFEENSLLVKEKLGGDAEIIAMDSNFSPIRRTNFEVMEVNPGESRVFERLVLEIETKGNILPEKVVAFSGSILNNYYNAFNEMSEVNMDENFEEEKEEDIVDTQLTMTIETLNLSVRSENALKAAGITTVEELIDRPVSSLQVIKNLGEKSKIEIIQTVQDIGLSFKSE